MEKKSIHIQPVILPLRKCIPIDLFLSIETNTKFSLKLAFLKTCIFYILYNCDENVRANI